MLISKSLAKELSLKAYELQIFGNFAATALQTSVNGASHSSSSIKKPVLNIRFAKVRKIK